MSVLIDGIKNKGLNIELLMLKHNIIKMQTALFKSHRYSFFLLKKSGIIYNVLHNYICVYNGNVWTQRRLFWWHFGHSVGELLETRKPFYYFSKKNKKNKRLLKR